MDKIYLIVGLIIASIVLSYYFGKAECEVKIKEKIITIKEKQEIAVARLPKTKEERLQWIKSLKVRL